MGRYDQKKAHAERLYVEEGWTAKKIAAELSIAPNTVGKWVKDGNWKEKKTLIEAAPHRIKLRIIEEYESVLNGNEPSFNADYISKLSRALERVDKKQSVPDIITMLKNFDNWMVSHIDDPEFVDKMLVAHKQYIQHLISFE